MTYPARPEPFAEALGEAAQTAAMAGLQQAGAGLGVFLSQMGRMTAGVHQAVTANAARIKAEGSDRWAGLLRTTMPEGLVRDAILASPAWPDIAAAMGYLDAKGIDVARIFTDAHRAGVGVCQAGAAVTAAAANTPAPASTAVAAPAPAPASTAPAAIAVAAPGTAAGAAAPARDVLAERMGAVGDPWAAPARRAPALAAPPMDLPTLWHFAGDWHTQTPGPGFVRRDPAAAASYFAGVGLRGSFWGLPDKDPLTSVCRPARSQAPLPGVPRLTSTIVMKNAVQDRPLPEEPRRAGGPRQRR